MLLFAGRDLFLSTPLTYVDEEGSGDGTDDMTTFSSSSPSSSSSSSSFNRDANSSSSTSGKGMRESGFASMVAHTHTIENTHDPALRQSSFNLKRGPPKRKVS